VEELLRHLAASGPLALALGLAVAALWKANQKERERNAAEVKQIRADHAKELEDQRKDHVGLLKAECDRHATEEVNLRREVADRNSDYVNTLKGLTSAVRGGP
jgi:hypothetical protein